MNRGDLVKLVLPPLQVPPAGVVVSWQRGYGVTHHAGVVDAPLATRFPEGTLAVFLGDEPGGPADAPSILIEGRVGWVWSRYLEAV